jgi:DNA-binding MarR family transcriptional regulator
VSIDGSRTKAALAAEAWGAVLDLAMGQRNRFFRILQGFGLTPGDMRALAVLDPDEPRPMGALAEACQCDASNVTWMVDRLEERGLVERRMHASDRRVKTVALTPRGVETKAKLFERLHEPPPEFLALDRANLESVRDALAKLPATIRAHGLHTPPPQATRTASRSGS